MVNIDTFNNLSELLTRIGNVGGEEISEHAKKINKKILKYSVPHTEENGETFVDIRFFHNEITQLVHILLSNISNYEEYQMNYFEELLISRKGYNSSS